MLNILFWIFVCIGAAAGWLFLIGIAYDAYKMTIRQLEREKRQRSKRPY